MDVEVGVVVGVVFGVDVFVMDFEDFVVDG